MADEGEGAALSDEDIVRGQGCPAALAAVTHGASLQHQGFPSGDTRGSRTAPAGSRPSGGRILGEAAPGTGKGMGCCDTSFLYVNTGGHRTLG